MQSPESTQPQHMHLTADQMKEIGYRLIDKFVDHLTSLPEQPVLDRQSNIGYQKQFGESLPIQSTEIIDCVDDFFERVVPGMTRVNHPRFHAFIPCPSSFAGSIGMMMSAATNPFVGSWLGGASLASLELMVIEWIKESLKLTPSFAGIFSSGGSMANLIGLASARAKYGRAVIDRGTIYVSEEGHASVEKAASVLGFSDQNIRRIPTNDQYQISIDALVAQIRSDRNDGLIPFVISANAGTTNTGAIDDITALADLCDREEIWFHIDAAYGGFAALAPEIRLLMKGMERCDSLTLDPHKWLYCPMGVGCAMVKDLEFMEAAFSTHGSYLKDLDYDEVNFLERGPELSRPARALPVWMVMRAYGQNQLIAQIKQDIQLAKLAATLLSENDRFEIHSLNLSIVTFRHRLIENETEQQRSSRDDLLIDAILEDGETMISSTTLKGRNTLRLVVMNPATTEAEIRRSVDRINILSRGMT